MLQQMKVLLKSLAGFGIVAFSFYWFTWPYFFFNEPKAFYFIKDNAKEIAEISGQGICDIDQTQQRLVALVRLKDPDMHEYFRDSVRISDGLKSKGCSIQVLSGFDVVFYEINDACWNIDGNLNLPLYDCKNH